MIPWEWGSIYSGISPFGNSPCVSSKILPATSSRLPPFKELHRCFCCVTTWLVWAAKHWFQPTVPLPLVVRWIVFFGIWLQQISTSFITRNRAKPISFQVWTQQLGPPTSTYNMHPCGMLPCRWLACLVASWKPKTGCQHPFSSWLSAHESYMKIHEVTVPWGMPSSGLASLHWNGRVEAVRRFPLTFDHRWMVVMGCLFVLNDEPVSLPANAP